MMLLGFGSEVVEDHSGLHAGDAAGGINLQNARHVFGEIENDGGVAALSGERGAATAGEQRRAVFAAQRHSGQDIFGVARNYDSDWDLAVVRAVDGVEGAGTGIEADFSAEVAAKGSL